MERWISVLRTVSLVEFSALALLTIWQWRRSRLRGAGWAAATFGMLAAVSITGRFIPQIGSALPMEWVIKALIAVLLLVPFALFKFAGTFDRPSRAIRLAAGSMTAIVIGWTVLLPYIPAPGAPQPSMFVAYRFAVGAQWFLIFTFIATRLWRAAAVGSTPTRRRMRLLAAGSIGMDVPILIGTLALGESVRVALASQVVGVVSAVLFGLALAPPASLRLRWRRDEQNALRAAVADLLGATSAQEVAERIVPHAAAVVGAAGVALVDESGKVLATHGDTPDPAGAAVCDETNVRVPLQHGALLLKTSPYAPFFGRDELELLEGLGYFLDLALDRCDSVLWEREFIANAAHELRTPLTVLSGLAATLSARRETMAPEGVGDCLDAMERQGARACRLVSDLLDLAQLDRGALHLSVEPVGLAQAVAVSRDATPIPDGAHLDIDVDPGHTVLADRGRLDQVLVNLMSNALRHGGTVVRVTTARRGAMVEIAVTDDGPGLDPEVAPRIFQPFARTLEASGSGLGLAICVRVVEALGGTIHHEAVVPHGARFVVRLPAATAAPAAEDGGAPIPLTTRRELGGRMPDAADTTSLERLPAS